MFDHDDPNVWAPDVYYDPDTELFYLYYSANLRIGVAVASSPLGPFEDRGIFIESAIDARMFRDDDHRLYLYYEGFGPGGGRTMVQPMRTPLDPEGDPILLLIPEGWEAIVTEGQWMVKHGGVYYLMYSGNLFTTPEYGIGYATSASPTGPFVRFPDNPLVRSGNGVIGPGHHSVVEAPDGGLAIVYHQKKTTETVGDRFVCVDRMGFDESGQIWVNATPMFFP